MSFRTLATLVLFAAALGWLATGCDGCDEAPPQERPDVERLHFGTYHFCALDEHQQVWCAGKNDLGQLGDGTTAGREEMTKVVGLDDESIAGLAVGFFDTTCAWNDDGEVFCWGNNTHGVLADDQRQFNPNPIRIDDLPPVAEVTLGAYHACALTEDAEIYCWGYNNRGQLGIGHGVGPVVTTPQPIEALEQVQQVRAGAEHTCAIDADGALFCWGFNEDGQLGIGEDLPGTTDPTPVDQAPDDAIDLAVSFRHSCATFGERRELYCWGNNDYGQLGLDDLDRRFLPTAVAEIAYVDELAAGGGQSCARIDDRVFCAGEVLRPVEIARETGEGYFFRPSPALQQTTELWSGVLGICGPADDHAVACRGVQHQTFSEELF